MALFTPEELDDIRGGQAPPGLTEHGMAAFDFIRSSTMSAAAAEDQHYRDQAAQEIRLAIVVDWPEVDRASRALQHVDRELRRCARAWATAYENSSKDADESIFSSPRWFLSELELYPTPVHVAQGRLAIRGAQATPALALVLEPEEEVFAVLAEWPRASLAYVLSIFGTAGYLSTSRGAQPRPEPADEEVLAALGEGAPEALLGRTADEEALSMELRDFRRHQRRAIAESFDEDLEEKASGVRVALHRTLVDGTPELISARVA